MQILLPGDCGAVDKNAGSSGNGTFVNFRMICLISLQNAGYVGNSRKYAEDPPPPLSSAEIAFILVSICIILLRTSQVKVVNANSCNVVTYKKNPKNFQRRWLLPTLSISKIKRWLELDIGFKSICQLLTRLDFSESFCHPI